MVETLPKLLLDLIESIGGPEAVRRVCERAELSKDRAFRLSEVRDGEEWNRLLDASSDFLLLSEVEVFFNDALKKAGGKEEDIKRLRFLVKFSLDAARRAVKNAEKKSEALARSNNDLEQFAYIASHDLQAPLRRITSFCQLLKHQCREKLDESAQDYIDLIIGSARRMGDLLNDLLDYSKVEKAPRNLELIDCEEVFQEAVNNLEPSIAELNAVVTRDPLPKVHASRAQLVRLFQNLIGNGIKFHGENPPEVYVRAAEKDGDVLFEFRDNGIGIPEESADKVFVLFQRLHEESKYSGTGLGLAICKKIVERHKGRIWVKSEPGVGSRFFVLLPKTKSEL